MRISDPNFEFIHERIDKLLENQSDWVPPTRWQGENVSNKPDMATRELLNVSIEYPLFYDDFKDYHDLIKPNLPWADDHFNERVCGVPINPGVEWKNWPWGKNAEKFLEDGQFNHNYMERYWPKFAGVVANPTETRSEWVKDFEYIEEATKMKLSPINGIKGHYGDLTDVLDLLLCDPYTRQAYLPIFFPEDTGNRNPGRKPCTLGYQFIMRRNKLHIYYPMRSCDFVRHFRDDVYLTIRLLLWVLGRLRQNNVSWDEIGLGNLTMHMTSLHKFINDK